MFSYQIKLVHFENTRVQNMHIQRSQPMLKVILILHANTQRGNLIICGINNIWVTCTTTHVCRMLHVPTLGPFRDRPWIMSITTSTFWWGFFLKPAPI